MNLEEINQMARNMGFTDTYLNKLQASNKIIDNMYNRDRNALNIQLNQALRDYEKERETQNQNFIKEGQSAYVDYAKAINPYSNDRSSNARIGLNNSGFSESSLINANNTYQNRYTETKNNYENIFADINDRITKAKENKSIEEAELAKNYQNQMLENLWRLDEENQAYKESLANSYYSSSSNGSGYDYEVLTNQVQPKTSEKTYTLKSLPATASSKKAYKFMHNMLLTGGALTASQIENKLKTAKQNGTINQSDVKKILKAYGM